MESLKESNDVEEIQKLLEQLKITEDKNKQIQKIEQIKSNKENTEVILNYSTSDKISMEKEELCNTKSKRKWEEYWNNSKGLNEENDEVILGYSASKSEHDEPYQRIYYHMKKRIRT